MAQKRLNWSLRFFYWFSSPNEKDFEKQSFVSHLIYLFLISPMCYHCLAIILNILRVYIFFIFFEACELVIDIETIRK